MGAKPKMLTVKSCAALSFFHKRQQGKAINQGFNSSCAFWGYAQPALPPRDVC